jgi:hypothetical protein
MFERLLLCDFAVADLTTANANVFYELGVRHAVRVRSDTSSRSSPRGTSRRSTSTTCGLCRISLGQDEPVRGRRGAGATHFARPIG